MHNCFALACKQGTLEGIAESLEVFPIPELQIEQAGFRRGR